MAIRLILGGTKSGKTTYAQELAKKIQEAQKKDIKYVATSKVLDKEMEERVKHHISTRPSHWETIEESYDIKKIINDNSSIYILDCLTMLLTNHFMKNHEYNRDEIIETIKDDIREINSFCNSSKSIIIIISNQVEVGLVSTYKLGRDFQDASGLIHQFIATLAEEVVIMNAGIPLKIK